MNRFSRDGFVLDYLVTKVKQVPYQSDIREKDQLKLEMRMRKDIVTQKPQELSLSALHEQEWMPNYSYGNVFLDRSAFYSKPQRISFYAATAILAKQTKSVDLVVWTYMALGLYHDGTLVLTIDPPQYKPILQKHVRIQLHQGVNTFFVQAENLGVRDTRNIFGLQITSPCDDLQNVFPLQEFEQKYRKVISFLDGIQCEKDHILFGEPAPEGTTISYPDESPEYHPHYQAPCQDVSHQRDFKLHHERTQVDVACQGMTRRIQIGEYIVPLHLHIPNNDERYRYILQKIADVETLNRGDHGFSIFNILARNALHIQDSKDKERLLADLDLIDKRVDCSDFILLGIIRYMHNYSLEDDVAVKARKVFHEYRYWMDMEGQDGMCFWSENHSLIFYFCAYEIGRMFPQDYFTRAALNGQQLSAMARKRLSDWLDDVQKNLFEEFLSSVYMCVTFAALLNVYDYADEELSQKAEVILDKMVAQLSIQTFDGAMIAPMGRVYRDCIFPFKGAANSILSLASNEICYDYAEGWMSFFATSHYHFKTGIDVRIHNDCDTSYTSGNARIVVKKTSAYILTSVASPRHDTFTRFENVLLQGGLEDGTHRYTKSMNECFHGTSCFQSGCYGYQQHLWYVALSSDAVFFMNHPGTTCEDSSLRPGYWHGNGVFPALKQEGALLAGIYHIPQNYPVHFVHAYLPSERFDEVLSDGPWIYCRKNTGYFAFWCPIARTPYNDRLFHCEIRYIAETVPFVVVAGDEKEYGGFQQFRDSLQSLEPAYASSWISMKGKQFLKYQTFTDATQIIR